MAPPPIFGNSLENLENGNLLPPPIFGNNEESGLMAPPIFGNNEENGLMAPPIFNTKKDFNLFDDPVPKNKMKKIFIDDIYPNDLKNSIFANLKRKQDLEINFDFFEESFKLKKKKYKKEEEKVKKIENDYILNQQKINNISIALYKFNHTIEELIISLKENNKKILKIENFEILQRIFPNLEDIKLLQNAELEGNFLNLCKTEKFLIKLIKIPFVKKLTDIIFLKEDIYFLLKTIKKIENFKEPFTLLLKNRNFKSFIVIILRFVNFLNYGSRHKNKKGLSFKNILRICKFSGNDKKKNILYFTVKAIFCKNSKFFHFSEDFVNIIRNFNCGIDELYEMKKNLIEKIKSFSDFFFGFEKEEFFPYLKLLEDLRNNQKQFKINLFDVLEEFNDLDSKFEEIKNMYILKNNCDKQVFLKEFYEINKNILQTIKLIKNENEIEKNALKIENKKIFIFNEKNKKSVEIFKIQKKETISKYKKETISNSKIKSEKKN